MKKKTGSSLLAIALAMVMLTACAGNNSTGSTNTPTNPQQTPANTDNSPAPDENAELAPVTIEIDTRSATPVELPAADEDVIVQAVKETFNADLKYSITIGNLADWKAKLGTRVAAGDLPELIYFSSMSDYWNAVDQGYLLEMNDYFGPGNMPENLDFVTEELLKGISDANGNYYGVPVRPAPTVTGWYIRQDWLDALEMELPKTVEEFAEVAEAFAQRDPDGNGKKDTYGYTAFGSVFGHDYWGLMTSFLGFVFPEEYIKDGKLVGGFTAPAVREYLTYMNGLMRSGGLDPEAAINDATRKAQKIEQGQVGIFQFVGGYPTEIVNNAKQLNPNAEFVYLPPVEGPAGPGFTSPRSGISRIYGVTLKAGEDPEKVRRIVDIINWMNGGEGEQLVLYGAEGVNHIKENGKVSSFIVPTSGQPNLSQYLDLYNLSGPFVTRLDDPEALAVRFSDPHELEVIQQILSHQGDVGSVYGLGFAREPADIVGDLKGYREQMFSKFIYGAESLDDAGWNAYVEAHDGQYRGQQVREAMLEDLRNAGVAFEE